MGREERYPVVEGRERAMASILRYVQSMFFSKEITCLKSDPKRDKSVLKRFRLHNLFPFLGKDGLLRIGGCLGDQIESPYPVIMPRDKLVVNKLIHKIHVENGHAGAATVNHLCRQKFWVLQGGAAARSVVANCIPCRRRFKPPEKQLMAKHPRERCVPAFPFEATGVDYALRSQGGRTTVKRWVSVFTCLCCRAIHVEVVDKGVQ